MRKRPIKFISEFLIPSLNKGCFQNRLKWLDEKSKTFQLSWYHKGGPNWTKREAEVFVEWDKRKGHYHPHDKEYYTKSKQRFRALLYKLKKEGHIIRRKSDDKFIKIYSIDEYRPKKRKSTTSESSECMYSDKDEEFNDQISFHASSCEKRFISNNCMINILEDHAYSSATRFLKVVQTDNVPEYNFDCETLYSDEYLVGNKLNNQSDDTYTDLKHENILPICEEEIHIKTDSNLHYGCLKRNIETDNTELLSSKCNEDRIDTRANNSLNIESFDESWLNLDLSNYDAYYDLLKYIDDGELLPETNDE